MTFNELQEQKRSLRQECGYFHALTDFEIKNATKNTTLERYTAIGLGDYILTEKYDYFISRLTELNKMYSRSYNGILVDMTPLLINDCRTTYEIDYEY